ncbi:MAG: translation initiation factor IF-1 [Bdellovibrionia bacterium]
MARDDLAQIEGKVTDVLAGGNFTVQLAGGQTITAKLSGRMRKFHIRVILGDRVTVGVSPYDPTHGLILHRHKEGGRPGPGPDGGAGFGAGPR